jgi:hypothetical protein
VVTRELGTFNAFMDTNSVYIKHLISRKRTLFTDASILNTGYEILERNKSWQQQ